MKDNNLSLWKAIWRGEDLSVYRDRINKVNEEDTEKTSISNIDNNNLFSYCKPFTYPNEKQIIVDRNTIIIYSQDDLRDMVEFKDIYNLSTFIDDESGGYRYNVPLTEGNCFLVRHLFKGSPMRVSSSSLEIIRDKADEAPVPSAVLDSSKKFIIYRAPKIKNYDYISSIVTGRPSKEGYKIPIAKAFDFLGYAEKSSSLLPSIAIDSNLMNELNKDIRGFDGTLSSLRNVEINELSSVRANHQNWFDLKKSSKSLEDKLKEYGEETLYDVIFNIPRRYIDKSKPQDFASLIPGEDCTIIGTIKSSYLMKYTMANNREGRSAKFTVSLPPYGKTIEATFWGQHWLIDKYKEGSEVVITGKVGFFGKKKTISGSSIDPADDASILPIVPVYKQSAKLGLTTSAVMSASREFFNRLEGLNNPYYLPDDFGSLQESLKNLHFPQTSKDLESAREFMAKLELLYTQIELSEYRAKSAGNKSVVIEGNKEKDFMSKAISSLPYDLTGAQKRAISEMTELINSTTPMNVLLNADVGAGKTVTAQSVCLKAAESGFQSVMIAPTETLAVQLYHNLEKFVEPISNEVSIAYLSGSVKTREKNRILKALKEGSIDIVIGTHSLFSENVEYHNLGLVVFDEQQKFGVEHRDRLLSRRKDNLSPHFLMQSATPIPASIAQVFYGDLKCIILDEKPAGRKDIETLYIPIQASEILSDDYINHDVWVDIRKEASKGHQTFIVTPMVKDSEKIDAASVEESYKTLSKGALKNLRIGYIHGQMKKDKAADIMAKFKNKELDVLIGSTIIEVGVDVPDATRIVILSADRFGASTLHQIRGRVGRNDKHSRCYLVTEEGKGESRIEAMVKYSDGFDIAKADLETRKEGIVFSSEQSGSPAMRFASILTHRDLIDSTKEIALSIWTDEKARKQALLDSKDILKV